MQKIRTVWMKFKIQQKFDKELLIIFSCPSGSHIDDYMVMWHNTTCIYIKIYISYFCKVYNVARFSY